jgi:hypothetical protein
VNKQTKRKPTPKRQHKPDDTGLALLLRKRRPRGGFVVLAKYSRLKSVAA